MKLKLKIGEKVELLVAGCSGDNSCCKEHGYIIGKKYEVTGFTKDSVRLKKPTRNTGGCWFVFSCVKKTKQTLRELIEE